MDEEQPRVSNLKNKNDLMKYQLEIALAECGSTTLAPGEDLICA